MTSRRVFIDGDGFADCLSGPVGVSATEFGDAADVGDGIVFDFLSEGAFDVGAVGVDGSGCADGGVGRHGGDVTGHGDEGAGAGGASADGCDVDGDGDIGAAEALDDFAHGGVEAAGCIELEDDETVAAIFGV
ncbi:MAG: hypothetical protein C4321_08840, partial [Chloroflexota bacterium]